MDKEPTVTDNLRTMFEELDTNADGVLTVNDATAHALRFALASRLNIKISQADAVALIEDITTRRRCWEMIPTT